MLAKATSALPIRSISLSPGRVSAMPITAEHVGRRYPAAPPYEVSRAKIAEFATAIRDDNPAYFSDSPIAPPTFASASMTLPRPRSTASQATIAAESTPV